MIQQAKQMQKQMESMLFDLEENGIKIKINGKLDILSFEIVNSELLEDKEKLESMSRQTVNSAIQKAQREAAMQMQNQIGGLF